MEQRQLAQGFVDEVLALPGGENLNRCYNCGTCTSACPISWIDARYNPRRILQAVVYGQRDEALSNPAIWLCSACDICYHRCPQLVHLSDVMKAIRTVAIGAGYEPERTAAQPNERLCSGCGLCVQACPYEAIKLVPTWIKGRQQGIFPQVDRLLCQECGICTAACPVSAINVEDVNDEAIVTQVTEFASETTHLGGDGAEPNWEPKIMVFLCEWCLYSNLDQIDIAKVREQPNVRIVRIPCLGRMDPWHALTALQEGIDGVLIAGCRLGDCHYKRGNFLAENKMTVLRAILAATGEKGRVKLAHISTAERGIFPHLLEETRKEIKALGPIEPFGWPLSQRREEVHSLLFSYGLVAVQQSVD